MSDERTPRHSVLRITVSLAILFLWFPLGLIVLYAFTTDEVVPTFPPPGLTTKWFGVARDNPEIWDAMWLSTRVALLATLLSLVLGSMAAAAVVPLSSAELTRISTHRPWRFHSANGSSVYQQELQLNTRIFCCHTIHRLPPQARTFKNISLVN